MKALLIAYAAVPLLIGLLLWLTPGLLAAYRSSASSVITAS